MNSSDFSSAQTAGTVPSNMFFGADLSLGSPYSGSYSNARALSFSIYSYYSGNTSTSYNAFNTTSATWSTAGVDPVSGETIDLFWEMCKDRDWETIN